MLNSMPRYRRLSVHLIGGLALFAALNSAYAQAPSNKAAELSEQDKLRQILNRFNNQQKEELSQPSAKASAAAQAASRIAEVSKNADAFRQWQAERDRSTSSVIRSVERSGLTGGDDITYPKDWKEKTQARSS